jgi:predicted NBD/HSP70 family sugar kinase
MKMRPKSGTSHAIIRKSLQTELSVLKLIQAAPAISRVELAEKSGLSTAGITGIVTSLVNQHLVVEGSAPVTPIGRKRIGLSLSSDLGCVVGIDMGTYNLRVVVTDMNGNVLSRSDQASEMRKGKQFVLDHCFSIVRETLQLASVPNGRVLGIGVAFSGLIDVERGVILSYPRPGLVQQWKDVPLKQIFEDEFNTTALIDDSVRAIATQDRFAGAGKDLKDFVYVDVGMGVGSAIFIDGQIYRGSGGKAGEFGHMTINESGPLCCCGSNGCLEALASCTTVIQSVKDAMDRGVASKVIDMADRDPDKLTIEMIAEAAEQGDSLAYRSLHEAASHIGAACSDLVNLLNPQAIVFGGALFRASPQFMLDQIRHLIRRKALEKSASDVSLVLSPVASDGGARGMARLISAKLVEPLYFGEFNHKRGTPEALPAPAPTAL